MASKEVLIPYPYLLLTTCPDISCLSHYHLSPATNPTDSLPLPLLPCNAPLIEKLQGPCELRISRCISWI